MGIFAIASILTEANRSVVYQICSKVNAYLAVVVVLRDNFGRSEVVCLVAYFICFEVFECLQSENVSGVRRL